MALHSLSYIVSVTTGAIQKVEEGRVGSMKIIEKQTKANRGEGVGRGVLAYVYVRFLKKKCWDFQNEVL